MEVVSTSNLVYTETKKAKACNFETINSFVMSYDLMRGVIRSHANKILLIRSFMMVEL